jgi:hypothetical protein
MIDKVPLPTANCEAKLCLILHKERVSDAQRLVKQGSATPHIEKEKGRFCKT